MKKFGKFLGKALLTLAILAAAFFAVTFAAYFFNLDMKLTAAIEPLMKKVYDRIDRDQHL
jgi:hypothetical protein